MKKCKEGQIRQAEHPRLSGCEARGLGPFEARNILTRVATAGPKGPQIL